MDSHSERHEATNKHVSPVDEPLDLPDGDENHDNNIMKRSAVFRGRQLMELFAKVAHEQGADVIVVTHDHRELDVVDTIYEMEDGLMRQQTISE